MSSFDQTAYLKTGAQFAFMLSWLPSATLIGAADAGSLGSGHPHILGALLGLILFSCLYFGYIFSVANWPIRKANAFILLSFNVAVFFLLPTLLKVEGNVAAFSAIFASVPGVPLLAVTMFRHMDCA